MIDRYSTKEMRDLWSDDSRFKTWFEVELAVCESMEQLAMVPDGVSKRIRESSSPRAQRILEIEQITRHDVIAFLTDIEEQSGDDSRWLHLGLTSSDVLDTSFALLLVKASQMILDDLETLSQSCLKKAEEYRNIPIMGRTHGIHAEPTSLGVIFALFYSELERNRERLERAAEGIRTGKIAGAVGTYANIDPDVERIALGKLGLNIETVATQVVQRDRHAEFFNVLAQIAASCEKISLTFRHWQRTEVSEVFEPFGKGQKGSSAMPHKRNPILAENISGLARTVRGYAATALENVALWHERDISHSSVERIIAPDATSLTQFMLKRLNFVVSGCSVNHEAIERNLALTKGLVFSEAVLIKLVMRGVLRQKAYEAVQSCAMMASSGNGDFIKLMSRHPLISEKLSPEEIKMACDIKHHIRHTGMIIDRALEKKRK
ncbi:MAG: adenylosuccinate lyase [Deltaproteobacteria bacterium]|nr:adenylosuccinate lyase [Deltaproteobacteria bacterium]